MKEKTKCTAKSLMSEMSISRSTAYKYLSDIKKEYEIKIVTISHVNRYLKVS